MVADARHEAPRRSEGPEKGDRRARTAWGWLCLGAGQKAESRLSRTAFRVYPGWSPGVRGREDSASEASEPGR